VFELVEEAFDEVAKAIEAAAERGALTRPGMMGLTSPPAPCPASPRAQAVAVVAAIGEQNLSLAEAIEHVAGVASVVGLAGRQLQQDRQAASGRR
jgi:hypothetical protein